MWGGAVAFTHLRTSMMQPLDNATTRKVFFRFGVQYKDVAPLECTQEGGIDAYWTLLKDGIPNSINSTVGGKPNKVLWMYMRSQQWRWERHEKDILAETGQTLATL